MQPERLAALAEAVADGQTLDWNAAELNAATPEERAAIGAFRDLFLVCGLFATASSSALTNPARIRARLSPGASWGALLIKAHVGRGRFGDVYRAWDPALERDVALKLIDDDAAGRASGDVITEGRLMARVRHANVLTIHGAQRIDDITGLAMEFVEGSTLEQELAARGPFHVDELVRTGVQVAEALAAVHAAGLVHRDVKASNVLRERASGRVLLGDFGTGRDLEASNIGMEGLVGTPAYLAPEIFAGQSSTPQSDLYSLGVLLFRLATGEYPMRERSIAALRSAHAKGERPTVRDRLTRLPQPLVAIIDRALDPDPSRRFESAEFIVEALRRYQRQPARRRNVIFAAVAAIALIALAGYAGRALWRPPLSFSERDIVLITTFDNRTDDATVDDAVADALEFELADSGFATVASPERVADTLTLMKRDPTTIVDAAVGREIAQRDGHIRVVVTGQVDRVGNAFRISARLIEPATGSSVASVREEARNLDDVINAVNRLARGVRRELGETIPTLPQRPDELPKVRTQSISALRKYAEALPDLYPDANSKVARQLLEEAVRDDPAFALAHLALAQAIQLDWKPATPAIEQAIDQAIMKHLDVSTRLVRDAGGVDVHIVEAEGGLLRAFLARDESADARRAHYERALQAAEMWQRLQPTSERAIRIQIELHGRVRRPASASLPLVNRLLELRPNALDVLLLAGQQADRAGQFALARQYLERAKPLLDLPIPGRRDRRPAMTIRWGSFTDAWNRNDLPEMKKWAAQLEGMRAEMGGPDARQAYAEACMWVAITLGQLDRAESIAATVQHPYYGPFFSLQVAKRRGEPRRVLETTVRLFPDPSVLKQRNNEGLRLEVAIARRDFVEARRAITAAGEVWASRDRVQQEQGRIALIEGSVSRAIGLLQPLVDGDTSTLLSATWLQRSVLLADAYDKAGQPADAIRVLENVSSRKRELLNPGTRGAHEWLMARDHLARLYRLTGRGSDADAIDAELRILLSLADSDHPIARRLAGGLPARDR